jgi:hypothetical protein
MNGSEWVSEFAARLGVPSPDAGTIEVLLGLAGTAAHQSERTAAPIACYLVGLARIDPASAARVAVEVSPE